MPMSRLSIVSFGMKVQAHVVHQARAPDDGRTYIILQCAWKVCVFSAFISQSSGLCGTKRVNLAFRRQIFWGYFGPVEGVGCRRLTLLKPRIVHA